MPFRLFVLLISIHIAISASSQGTNPRDNETFTNPVWNGADPWIIKKDNYYFSCWSAGNAIYISRSEILTKRGEPFRIWRAPETGWNRTNVWAPELHFLDDHWYVYYAAGKAGPPFIHQRSGVLMSETADPFGQWHDMGMLYTGDNPDLKSDNRWAIDLTVFTYKGKLFAAWSGWISDAPTDKTPQHLYIAEMESPVKIREVRTRISSPDQPWETGGPLDLQEGPAILQKNGRLFIVYSCRESWRVEYRLGILRLKGGSLNSEKNWEKSGPVFTGPYGAGHCSFTISPDGREDWIIYHSKKDSIEGWSRDVRMQPFKWGKNGYPEFGKASETGIPLKRPSGEIGRNN